MAQSALMAQHTSEQAMKPYDLGPTAIWLLEKSTEAQDIAISEYCNQGIGDFTDVDEQDLSVGLQVVYFDPVKTEFPMSVQSKVGRHLWPDSARLESVRSIRSLVDETPSFEPAGGSVVTFSTDIALEDRWERRRRPARAVYQLVGTMALGSRIVPAEVFDDDVKPNLSAGVDGLELLDHIDAMRAPLKINPRLTHLIGKGILDLGRRVNSVIDIRQNTSSAAFRRYAKAWALAHKEPDIFARRLHESYIEEFKAKMRLTDIYGLPE